MRIMNYPSKFGKESGFENASRIIINNIYLYIVSGIIIPCIHLPSKCESVNRKFILSVSHISVVVKKSSPLMHTSCTSASP